MRRGSKSEPKVEDFSTKMKVNGKRLGAPVEAIKAGTTEKESAQEETGEHEGDGFLSSRRLTSLLSESDEFEIKDNKEGVTVWPSDGMGVIETFKNGKELQCGYQRPKG